MKHQMDLEEFIRWLGCWLYMGCRVGIPNSRNWCSTVEPKLFVGSTFRLNNYMPRTRFEGILGYLHYMVQKDVGYYDGLFHMRQLEESCNLNMAEEFNPSWIDVLENIIFFSFLLTGIRVPKACVY